MKNQTNIILQCVSGFLFFAAISAMATSTPSITVCTIAIFLALFFCPKVREHFPESQMDSSKKQIIICTIVVMACVSVLSNEGELNIDSLTDTQNSQKATPEYADSLDDAKFIKKDNINTDGINMGTREYVKISAKTQENTSDQQKYDWLINVAMKEALQHGTNYLAIKLDNGYGYTITNQLNHDESKERQDDISGEQRDYIIDYTFENVPYGKMDTQDRVNKCIQYMTVNHSGEFSYNPGQYTDAPLNELTVDGKSLEYDLYLQLKAKFKSMIQDIELEIDEESKEIYLAIGLTYPETKARSESIATTSVKTLGKRIYDAKSIYDAPGYETLGGVYKDYTIFVGVFDELGTKITSGYSVNGKYMKYKK